MAGFFVGIAALGAVPANVAVTSDKKVLCKPRGLKSLDFFDTSGPPPKTPRKRPLQAGQLAAAGVC